VTFDDVRGLALSLPEVEEGTWYGRSNFKVRGRSFAGAPTIRGASAEEAHELLVVRIDPLERQSLLQAPGDAYFITPHYEDYPWVVVRLAVADREELRELLIEAWLASAPKRLVAVHEAELLSR
jgi:hypothetical protein